MKYINDNNNTGRLFINIFIFSGFQIQDCFK